MNKQEYITAYLISYKDFSDSWKWTTKIACRCIQLWTRSKYFHTELHLDGYRITSHTSKGVTVIKRRYNIEYLEQYADIKEIQIPKENVEFIISFANTQKGKSYDWKGIWLSQFLPLGKHNTNKWFCTEIVAEILKFSGLNNITEDSNRYNPGSFQELFKGRG